MINDITNYIKKCTICIRADAVRPIHHAALALDVTGIFERVGIDLSFGYPTTVDGFKRILVLIEYLSGYVMIYPIKSKSAEEIARHIKTNQFYPILATNSTILLSKNLHSKLI
jgi:hypothetical protein